MGKGEEGAWTRKWEGGGKVGRVERGGGRGRGEGIEGERKRENTTDHLIVSYTFTHHTHSPV